MMTDIENRNPAEGNGTGEEEVVKGSLEGEVVAIPKPYERSADVDRRVTKAVETMLETTDNPYETVVLTAQEARRLNEKKLKARSILTQAAETVDELVPEVPFVPRPIEDEEPEVKTTNEALERVALGLVQFELGGEVHDTHSYLEGEADFLIHREEEEEEEKSAAQDETATAGEEEQESDK
jgi:DNA-directed RNA polymerase subunit K/omega